MGALFFLAFPLFVSNAATLSEIDPGKIYETVPANKPLSSSPNFFIIDDFNNGNFEVRGGATWRIKTPIIGALDVSIDKKDARSGERGYSLKTTVNLEPNEKAFFGCFLNQIDVSQAAYFAFRVKTENREGDFFSGHHLSVILRDSLNQSATAETAAYMSFGANGWGSVVIPLSSFDKRLDLDRLTSLKFGLDAGGEALKGNLWIDDIAFFSSGDLRFESQRDNLHGFPLSDQNLTRQKKLKEQKNDRKFLEMIAQDTWKFFANARDVDTGLITDHILLGNSPVIANYTSPTNIAMDFLSIIAAEKLNFISRAEALQYTKRILETLQKMPRYQGFFYNFYDIKNLSIARKYISSVDSGWLAIALVVVRQAFPELAETATGFLDQFDFEEFLDTENNQLVVGLELPAKNFGGAHYGMLVTEARATSFYAIGKGDLPREHWWFLYRTLPEVWRWQNQKPAGRYVTREGVEYFQGYYVKDDQKFVPSWGGSLFEVLMPTIVLNEKKLAPKGLGLNNKIMTELQRDYALKEKKYPVWGLSPASLASGRSSIYREYGAPSLGAKGYPDRGVITPHVSFLALETLPEDAIKNLRKLLEYDIYGEYGFYDSLYLKTHKATPQYLSLDQGMSLVALANYLSGGIIQNLFHADPVAKRAESLINSEEFFNDN